MDLEKHPEFFKPGSIFNNYPQEKRQGVYTIADPENVNLKDNAERFMTNKVLVLNILSCDSASLQPGEVCASEEEIEAFFSTHIFSMSPMLNFIDFDEVDPSVSIPIQSINMVKIFKELDPKKALLERLNLIEARVSLTDDVIQLFTEPKTFSYLNFQQESFLELAGGYSKETHHHAFLFDLTVEVKIQSRVVNSLSGIFGEIVGIKDFIAFLLTLLLGSLPASRYLFDQVSTIFMQ